jgi:hypothetical protein
MKTFVFEHRVAAKADKPGTTQGMLSAHMNFSDPLFILCGISPMATARLGPQQLSL